MELIKLWQVGSLDYADAGLDKKVMYTEEFLQAIANDTNLINLTDEHSKKVIGSLSNFKVDDGVLYAEKPVDIDIKGLGFSPVFEMDLVDVGNYYLPRNCRMTSVGLTKNPRSKLLYNSIEDKEMINVSDELRTMLDKKEEIIAEQREEIGVLNKQMEDLREKSKLYDKTLKDFKALQKSFDELKANAENYKADSDKLHEQEAKAKEELIKEIVGDDEKGLEMFQKFSVDELEHMKSAKIITEPVKGVNAGSVDTITDGDAPDVPPEDEVDEFSPEYFEEWEKANTSW